MRKAIVSFVSVIALLAALACRTGSPPAAAGPERPGATAANPGPPETGVSGDGFAAARARMVSEQIEARGVGNPRVLEALKKVPRHLFVQPGDELHAYDDAPLPIGFGQTISQPYIVALMTELADPQAGEKALEIGTGSGYQAAVLSLLAKEVYTIEILPGLAARSAQTLKDLGYANVHVRLGDGYAGWPEQGPFDVILVTAAPESIPRALVEQLAAGGRLVLPVGPVYGVQDLLRLKKKPDGTVAEEKVAPVRFVPMVHGGGTKP